MNPSRSKPTRRALLATLTGALALATANLAIAAGGGDFPTKPIRIVVPAVAGGNLDNVTRIIATHLQAQLGQAVIVDNRPGASYSIGADYVSRAPADGYTFLAIADSFLYTPAIVHTARFDPLKDFTGVGIYASIPQILVVKSSSPANSLKDLVALGQKSPGSLTYGSAGIGSSGNIAAELFSIQAGIRMTHIPYKGNAPALVDVMSGNISMLFDTISTSLPFLKSGTLKALAVTRPSRTTLLPSVPTVEESGYPGYEAAIFNGLVARTGTPPEILERMNTEIRKATQQAALRAQFQAMGIEPIASESPTQFNAYLRSQSDKYLQLIKKANIHVE